MFQVLQESCSKVFCMRKGLLIVIVFDLYCVLQTDPFALFVRWVRRQRLNKKTNTAAAEHCVYVKSISATFLPLLAYVHPKMRNYSSPSLRKRRRGMLPTILSTPPSSSWKATVNWCVSEMKVHGKRVFSFVTFPWTSGDFHYRDDAWLEKRM
jgi:hypothetical protein